MQLKEEVTLELEAVGSGTRECRSVRGGRTHDSTVVYLSISCLHLLPVFDG